MRLQSLATLVFTIAMGCSSSGTDFIDFTASGSIVGEVTTLQIDADGHATRTRTRINPTDDAIQLSAETMADLRAKVAAANLPALDDHYGSNAADAILYEVTARVGGHDYTVSGTDDSDTPEALRELNSALSTIVNEN